MRVRVCARVRVCVLGMGAAASTVWVPPLVSRVLHARSTVVTGFACTARGCDARRPPVVSAVASAFASSVWVPPLVSRVLHARSTVVTGFVCTARGCDVRCPPQARVPAGPQAPAPRRPASPQAPRPHARLSGDGYLDGRRRNGRRERDVDRESAVAVVRRLQAPAPGQQVGPLEGRRRHGPTLSVLA